MASFNFCIKADLFKKYFCNLKKKPWHLNHILSLGKVWFVFVFCLFPCPPNPKPFCSLCETYLSFFSFFFLYIIVYNKYTLH